MVRTKEVREHWLERLLEIQKNIQTNGPEEFREYEIITMPEMRNIRRIWVFDKHEFDDTVPRIYKGLLERHLKILNG